jgi:hypothetical protein
MMLMTISTNATTTATPGLAFSLHLTERQHGVRESTDEDANSELARLILQDALDNPCGELTHSELHDDHGDRQYKCRETDH